MERLQGVIDRIRAVRDCESSRRLCLDCWLCGLDHGEDTGVALAETILESLTRWVEYERKIRGYGRVRRTDG